MLHQYLRHGWPIGPCMSSRSGDGATEEKKKVHERRRRRNLTGAESKMYITYILSQASCAHSIDIVKSWYLHCLAEGWCCGFYIFPWPYMELQHLNTCTRRSTPLRSLWSSIIVSVKCDTMCHMCPKRPLFRCSYFKGHIGEQCGILYIPCMLIWFGEHIEARA